MSPSGCYPEAAVAKWWKRNDWVTKSQQSGGVLMCFHSYTAEQGNYPAAYKEVLDETRIKTAAVTAATIQLN